MASTTGLTMPVVILSSRTDEAGIVQALETRRRRLCHQAVRHERTRRAHPRALCATGSSNRARSRSSRPAICQIDLVKRIVKVDGEEIKLSPKEYDILRMLAQHAGKVLTHQFLLKQVWGDAADVQYLRVYVRQLRQKIETTPDQPRYITTETGVGYRLREIE